MLAASGSFERMLNKVRNPPARGRTAVKTHLRVEALETRIVPAFGITVLGDPSTVYPLQPDRPPALTIDGQGTVWFANLLSEGLGRVNSNGSVTELTLPVDQLTYPFPDGSISSGDIPQDVTSDPPVVSLTPGPDGNIWFLRPDPSLAKIGYVTSSGAFTQFDLPGQAHSFTGYK